MKLAVQTSRILDVFGIDEGFRMIADAGFDGVECYYPRHGRAMTRVCLDICRRRNLSITAGYDCHGAFNHNIIACTRTDRRQCRLPAFAAR